MHYTVPPERLYNTAVAANWYWKLPSDDPLVSMPRLESLRLDSPYYGGPLAPLFIGQPFTGGIPEMGRGNLESI